MVVRASGWEERGEGARSVSSGVLAPDGAEVGPMTKAAFDDTDEESDPAIREAIALHQVLMRDAVALATLVKKLYPQHDRMHQIVLLRKAAMILDDEEAARKKWRKRR